MDDNYFEVPPQKLIYYIGKDSDLYQDLNEQLEVFGYNLRTFLSIDNILSNADLPAPDIILAHIPLTADNLKDDEKIKLLHQLYQKNIPIVYLSEGETLAERLQAVKMGGEAFFNLPLDTGALIDTLDNLSYSEPAEKYRVLIIDDSAFQANFFAVLLEKHGVICQLMNDPMQILQQLADFNPDLVLLDMYMPRYSGLELAKVIRQMEKFVGLPIVFLSAETDKEKQLEAMSLGGDDFLDKTINPAHFYAAISARIERYRKLRLLMTRDSLTGLNNHTLLIDRLNQELMRSVRYRSELSFIMIDIDHFKQVNDTYGHPTGDQVLKSLARLLKQRLRISDIIGRYGGEEFAVILPETAPKAALKVINELRVAFSNIRHYGGDKEFSITFSGGIAGFPGYKTAVEISDAADKALYTAKRTGRNRIVIDNK
ncbi:MAG: diguanylate cyclase [Anaerolineae bacterium]|nr:diguanylate cyclase [Anaerolineae bacterium]